MPTPLPLDPMRCGKDQRPAGRVWKYDPCAGAYGGNGATPAETGSIAPCRALSVCPWRSGKLAQSALRARQLQLVVGRVLSRN